MLTFKLNVPPDFGPAVRRRLETQIVKHLKQHGLPNITVDIDPTGNATFSGENLNINKLLASLVTLPSECTTKRA